VLRTNIVRSTWKTLMWGRNRGQVYENPVSLPAAVGVHGHGETANAVGIEGISGKRVLGYWLEKMKVYDWRGSDDLIQVVSNASLNTVATEREAAKLDLGSQPLSFPWERLVI